jgi:large subunit ribosomal protein L6
MAGKEKIEIYRGEVEIPKGVSVRLEDGVISVSGKKGTLNREFGLRKGIKIDLDGNKVIISAKSPKKQIRALAGTTSGHISNMITGVMKGYKYQLKIYYLHFPMNVSVEKDKVTIKNFLGEKYPRKARIVGENTKVDVKGQDIYVYGPDKGAVGQTTANIEQATKIAGFKDPRVFQDGIFRVSKGIEEAEG